MVDQPEAAEALPAVQDDPSGSGCSRGLNGDRRGLTWHVSLAAHGWQRQPTLEIPQGPCCSLWTAGGHRIALYQLTRPEVASHFDGRRDF
jgi:hypothetical protein